MSVLRNTLSIATRGYWDLFRTSASTGFSSTYTIDSIDTYRDSPDVSELFAKISSVDQDVNIRQGN